MGLDLTVYPITVARSNDRWLAYQRLGLERDYDLFDRIKRLEWFPLLVRNVSHVDFYRDEGIESDTEDAYGNPLRFVLAGSFKDVAQPDDTQWNRAVLNFLASIPPAMPVILDWN